MHWSNHTPQLKGTPVYFIWTFGTAIAKSEKKSILKSKLFSVLATQWWNELPADERTPESLNSFHKRLKTHLFKVHQDSV